MEQIPDAPNRKQAERLIELTQKKLAEQQQPGSKSEAKSTDVLEQRSEGPGPVRTALLWTGVGLTVALAATGVVTGQLAHDRSEEYLDPSLSLERKRELRDTGQAMKATSVITLSLAGAAAIGTVVYYFWGYRRARRSTFSVVPTAMLLSGGGGLSLSGEL